MTSGIGNGGGHFDKAGGFISARRFSKSFGGDIEELMLERAEEYFENFDLIRYTDEISSPELLHRYRKKPAVLGFVKSCEREPRYAYARLKAMCWYAAGKIST